MKKDFFIFATAVVLFFGACSSSQNEPSYSGSANDEGLPAGVEVPQGAIPGVFSVGPGKKVFFKITDHYSLNGKKSFTWDKFQAEISEFESPWRVLSEDEWNYLLHKRPYAQQRIGLGKVSGLQSGIFILPDGWQAPAGLSTPFVPSIQKGLEALGDASLTVPYFNFSSNNFSHNSFNSNDYGLLLASGVLFLPINGSNILSDCGYYWSTTPVPTSGNSLSGILTGGYYFMFDAQEVGMKYGWDDEQECAIRLVRDM